MGARSHLLKRARELFVIYFVEIFACVGDGVVCCSVQILMNVRRGGGEDAAMNVSTHMAATNASVQEDTRSTPIGIHVKVRLSLSLSVSLSLSISISTYVHVCLPGSQIGRAHV